MKTLNIFSPEVSKISYNFAGMYIIELESGEISFPRLDADDDDIREFLSRDKALAWFKKCENVFGRKVEELVELSNYHRDYQMKWSAIEYIEPMIEDIEQKR